MYDTKWRFVKEPEIYLIWFFTENQNGANANHVVFAVHKDLHEEYLIYKRSSISIFRY